MAVSVYGGAAVNITERTFTWQELKVQWLFLVLRGGDKVGCFWPVPLELPAEVAAAGTQLRLLADHGYARPAKAVGTPAACPDPPLGPRSHHSPVPCRCNPLVGAAWELLAAARLQIQI